MIMHWVSTVVLVSFFTFGSCLCTAVSQMQHILQAVVNGFAQVG
jgi:hypothetical protein